MHTAMHENNKKSLSGFYHSQGQDVQLTKQISLVKVRYKKEKAAQ
jgi:hypothetical protein